MTTIHLDTGDTVRVDHTSETLANLVINAHRAERPVVEVIDHCGRPAGVIIARIVHWETHRAY